jgi:hypothetical protein
MERAAKTAAAGGNDALNARHATDPGTLRRVAEALHAQLHGQVIPAAAAFIGPPEQLEYRTCTFLGPLNAKMLPTPVHARDHR